MAEGGLLVVLAHPDDESLVAGTMARYADAGRPVTMLCATRGEAGEIAPGTEATPETLGAFRERELREACGILGVSDVRFLPFRDSGMAGTAENDHPRSLEQAPADSVVASMVEVIRAVRPHAVVTWERTGGYGHPDHMKVHQCATQAFHAAADARQFPAEGALWHPGSLFYTVIPVAEFGRAMDEMRRRGMDVGDPPGDPDGMNPEAMVAANCIIDVSGELERKWRALEAHRTQAGSFGIFEQMPEDLRRSIFGREHFHRASPPLDTGVIIEDLFAATGR